MRAGQLDRVITIQRSSATVDDYGTPANAWTDIGTVRAQIVQQSTEEFIRGFGASDETAIVFRIRWLAGVQLGDRVIYQNAAHNLKEVEEIGRRRGLELRCVASGGDQ